MILKKNWSNSSFFSLLCLLSIAYGFSTANNSKVAETICSVEAVEIVANGQPITASEQVLIKEIAQLPKKSSLSLSNNQLIKTAIQRLYQQGYVVDIKAVLLQKKASIKLQIHLLDQYPYLSAIQWKGITEKEGKELINQISLQIGTLLTPSVVKKTTYIIQNHFLSQGFANTKVMIDQKSIPFKEGKLCFQITKGDKVYIKKVIFKGNKYMTSRQLTKLLPYTKQPINTSQKLQKALLPSLKRLEPLTVLSHVWRFLRPNVFVEATLIQEVNYLKQHYQSKGFIGIDISYELTNQRGGATILFKISEGAQYKIGRIVWKGNNLLSSSKLNKTLSIKQGDVFNPIYWQEQPQVGTAAHNIYNLYAKKRFFLASFRSVIVPKHNEVVDLVIYLKEKQAPTINKITINKDVEINLDIVHMILKQNGLEKGKKITTSKLQACCHHMATSGLFEPEKIQLTPEYTSATSATLVCSLKAKSSKLEVFGELDIPENITMGGGFSNLDYLKILQGKKPKGGGQKLSLHFKHLFNPKLAPFFEVSFENPWIYLGKIPITFGATYSVSPKKKGVSIDFGKNWNRGHYRYKCKTIISQKTNPVFTSIPTCIIHLSRHSTNHLLYPTQGIISTLEIKGSKYINNDLNLNCLQGDHSCTKFLQVSLLSLPQPCTIKHTISGGLSYTNLAVNKPYFKFFLGGGESWYIKSTNPYADNCYVPLRGYNDASIGLLQKYNLYPKWQCYFMQNIELRYPFGKPTHSYGLLFLDAGYTGGMANLASGISFGIGYRIQTLLGIVGFDVGFPLLGKKKRKPKIHFYWRGAL